MSETKKILIVDDEPDLRKILCDFFSISGYETLPAPDGETALEIIKKIEPHLIILDMQMPGMGGLGFYNRIRTSSGQCRYPVIVLTARTHLEDLFKDFQVEAFVAKPFSMEELLMKVRSILAQRQLAERFPDSLLQSKKALLVENEKAKFDEIAGELAASGFLVCGVKSGVEALARAPIEQPDLVLSKLALPDIFGDLLTLQLRQTLRPDTKIVIYTRENPGLNSVLSQKICEQAGATQLIESDNAQKLAKAVVLLFQ